MMDLSAQVQLERWSKRYTIYMRTLSGLQTLCTLGAIARDECVVEGFETFVRKAQLLAVRVFDLLHLHLFKAAQDDDPKAFPSIDLNLFKAAARAVCRAEYTSSAAACNAHVDACAMEAVFDKYEQMDGMPTTGVEFGTLKAMRFAHYARCMDPRLVTGVGVVSKTSDAEYQVRGAIVINIIDAYIAALRGIIRWIVKGLKAVDKVMDVGPLIDAVKSLSPGTRNVDEVAAATGYGRETIKKYLHKFKVGEVVQDADNTPWGKRSKGSTELGREVRARVNELSRAHVRVSKKVSGQGINYTKMWRAVLANPDFKKDFNIIGVKTRKQVATGEATVEPLPKERVYTNRTFHWHMQALGIVRRKGRTNATLKESESVRQMILSFVARDQRLRGCDAFRTGNGDDKRSPIVLMFDEAAFHENPHDTTLLFFMADKKWKLVRKSGVGARIVVLDAMVYVPAGVSTVREEEHCEWIGWSHEGGEKSAYMTLDDPGDAADYKSGSGTMTSIYIAFVYGLAKMSRMT
ncbi:hypothetical protein T492DRAFT_882777 [Pavlovales sp. CCMP2436]|nr:hypothetical protein T492DRAFT_882777 [Pavlovales sp. CCMP2436]